MNTPVMEQQQQQQVRPTPPAREPDRHDECCPKIPELRRLQYFYGQMLTSADLQEEQRYFREKLRLMHRCVHGYGVLCGLRVVPDPGDERCDPRTDREREKLERELRQRETEVETLKAQVAESSEPAKARYLEQLEKAESDREAAARSLEALCPPSKDERPTARVRIECGVAIDCEGNEIVVRRSKSIDLLRHIESTERQLSPERVGPFWVSICYCETPVEPVRPLHTDTCAPADGCRHARMLESFSIEVTTEPPRRDSRCEPCCCSCGDRCLVLARIDRFVPGRPVPAAAIHNEVRRRFGLYDWVSITGISWVHDGDYTSSDAETLLGSHGQGDGLEFRFSRPVRSDTLRRGVIDVTVVEGGRGRAGDIYHMPGDIHFPAGGLVDRVYFRQTSDDKLHDGDLVRVGLRADFVLDECCRPVDGNHVGGRVPLLRGTRDVTHPSPELPACLEPREWNGPWTSGNGIGGGLFESWFGIAEPTQSYDKRGERK